MIIDIDMHRKRNENGYYYYFAFIKLHLYETNEAERLYDILEQKGIMHLVYDEEAFQYWEVKKHIPKKRRLHTISFLKFETIFRLKTIIF